MLPAVLRASWWMRGYFVDADFGFGQDRAGGMTWGDLAMASMDDWPLTRLSGRHVWDFEPCKERP